MKQMITLSIVLCSLLFGTVSTQALPARPQDPQHPASSEYPFKSSRQTLKIAGRNVDVYLPTLDTNQGSFPAIVFGHGQAIDVEGYDLTFKHFAQKGIAVIHPMFDSGFFDQDWRRMAKDFNDLTAATLEKLSDKINSNQIIYAGHSKGGYIALMAAGAPESKVKVKSLVLFAPAGFDADYLKAVDVEMPVTLAWSDGDTVIKQSLIQDIYNRLPSRKKQWILVRSYADKKADHFFPLSKKFFFGGSDGESAFHYYASWKWMIGAVRDVVENTTVTNPYVYGSEAGSTGEERLQHTIQRNW